MKEQYKAEEKAYLYYIILYYNGHRKVERYLWKKLLFRNIKLELTVEENIKNI